MSDAFLIQIDLGQGLTQRERTILYNSARRCEVYQLLTGGKAFEYELPEAGDSSVHSCGNLPDPEGRR